MEGPDGLGKTTLCDRLGKELWYPVYKDPAAPQGLEVTRDYIKGHDLGSLGVAVQTDVDIIFDRSFVSEYAYSVALKRENISWAQFEYIHRMLESVELLPVMMWCRDIDMGYQLACERGMTELEEDDWMNVWDAYEQYTRICPFRWTYVYADDKMDVNVDWVIRKVEEMRGI